MEYKDALKASVAVAAGAALYLVLNWVPLLGPLAVGLTVGYLVGGGFRRGFQSGLVSSLLGCALVVLAVYHMIPQGASFSNLPWLFMVWVLAVWNLAAVALTCVGAGFGAVGKDLKSMIPPKLMEIFSPINEKDSVDYIICPICGSGVKLDSSYCSECGKLIEQNA